MTESSQTAPLNLLATCPKGIEGLLADELSALGAEPGKTTVAGVYFSANLATAYRICLWSRLANRIILLLAREPMIDTAEQVLDVASPASLDTAFNARQNAGGKFSRWPQRPAFAPYQVWCPDGERWRC